MQHYVMQGRSPEFCRAMWADLANRDVAFRTSAEQPWQVGIVSCDIDAYPYLIDPLSVGHPDTDTDLEDVYDIVVLPD